MNPAQTIALFRDRAGSDLPLIGAAIGSGISTKYVLAGGADFILSATGGRFRYSGIPSIGAFFPLGNANEFILDFSVREILPRSAGKPVIVGLAPNDPLCDWDKTLDRIEEHGLHGVNNFPSTGFHDGPFRKALEKWGFTFAREVGFLARARERGLFTMAFVYTPEEARRMADAGIHAVCATQQSPAGSDPGIRARFKTKTPESQFADIFRAVEQAAPSCARLFYAGDAIDTPDDVDRILRTTDSDGYIGGSIFERVPTAHAVEEITGQYKKIIRLSRENKTLRQELIRKKGFDEIVGRSRIMQDLFDVVNKVADKDVNVLVTGESGTGKELIVKAIHYNSKRQRQPFIKVNCAAIPEALLESELFGHTKGAFTGATNDRVGLFQLADKGTLFLDEISELNLGVQAKLLRVIQQREMQRIGSDTLIKLDFRLVAATNRNLPDLVAAGKFREDLYYRLNVVSISAPALRSRREDINLMTIFFLRRIADKFELPLCRLAPGALEALQRYDWPGNVRELEHALESASILCTNSTITFDVLPAAIRNALMAETDGQDATDASAATDASGASDAPAAAREKPGDAGEERNERDRILRALSKNGWRRGATAKALSISRKTLYNKMARHGIRADRAEGE